MPLSSSYQQKKLNNYSFFESNISYELLWSIFSHLSSQELLNHARSVNKRWAIVATQQLFERIDDSKALEFQQQLLLSWHQTDTSLRRESNIFEDYNFTAALRSPFISPLHRHLYP